MDYVFKDIKNKTIIFTYLYDLIYKINININGKNHKIRNYVYLILNKIIIIIERVIKNKKRKYNYLYLRNINIKLMNLKLYINNDQCLDDFILTCMIFWERYLSTTYNIFKIKNVNNFNF